MSTPHTGQRDPPPAPRPLPGGESQSCGWWERPTDPWQVREGQGGMAGLLVSRKGVIAEEKAEQPLENQAGTASVSLLLREPWAAVAARPWRARGMINSAYKLNKQGDNIHP